MEASDPKEKIEYFTKSIEFEKVDTAVYYNRGLAFYGLKEYDKAIDDYSKAIEFCPKYPKAYNKRGNAFGSLKKYDKAIDDYNKAIDLDSKFSNPYYNLGTVYCELNEFDKSIASLTKAIELDPKFPLAYCNRGRTFCLAKNYDVAINDFFMAIALDSNLAIAYCYLGTIYGVREDYNQAFAEFNKAIRIDPKSWDAFFARGFLYGKLKQYDKAIDDFSSAIVIDSTNKSAYSFREFALGKLPPMPPILSLSNVTFTDKDNSNRIEANEDCIISFTITNSGKGAANNLKAFIKNTSAVTGLSFNPSVIIGTISPFDHQKVNIPISGMMNLTSGTAKFVISFEEEKGFPPDPIELNIASKEFIKPLLKIVDYSFLTDNGTIKLGYPIQLKTLIQNVGQGTAENVNISFSYTSSNIYTSGQKDFEIGILQAGSSKEIVFEFFANKLYSEKTIPITISLAEKYNKFGENKQVSINLDTKSAGSTINIASNAIDNTVNIQVASLSSDIDKNIPQNAKKNPNRYALIIGNEDYKTYQTDISDESNVEFALNDAMIFRNYAEQTLGLKSENVFLINNATAGRMRQSIELVTKIVSKIGSNAELVFYYAGHGFPDENTKIPYLIPVDVSATDLSSAIKLSEIFSKFTATGAGRITIFLDACFTGGGRESGLLASRSVKIKPHEDLITGNMVVFSASSGDQSALVYKEKKHGMFTYYLLKKLQETKGNVTYNDLFDYLKVNVSMQSLRLNSKEQDPQVKVSSEVSQIWFDWKF